MGQEIRRPHHVKELRIERPTPVFGEALSLQQYFSGESRWRGQHREHENEMPHEDGRSKLTARGPIGHNGLWGLTTAKYKDAVLVGEMDIRSQGLSSHRLALHLCGGEGVRSPDHWVEIDMIDLGDKARFSPMAALPIGLNRHQDQSYELPHPPNKASCAGLP